MPPLIPKASVGTEKFLWGFVSKLVGVAVGPGPWGISGDP